MSALLSGFLFALGVLAALALVAGALGLLSAHTKAKQAGAPEPEPPPFPRQLLTEELKRDSVYVAGRAVSPMPDLSHDELVKKLVQTSLELDMALRVASLKGIPVDVDLVDRKDPAHPKGRPQVRLSTKDSSGKVWQWPP